MTKIVTGKDLNLAYTKINDLDKDGLDRSLPALIWTNDNELEFIFDERVGRKGAWILSTKVEVLEDDYLTEEDEADDYFSLNSLL